MKDIEQKLREETSSLEIKTTSKMILSRFEEKQAEKKKMNLWVPLSSAAVLLAACSVTAFVLISPLTKGNDSSSDLTSENPFISLPQGFVSLIDQEVALDDQNLVSQTGLQLFFGSQLTGGENTLSRVRNLKSRYGNHGITAEQEEIVKTTYDEMFSTINSFFSTNDRLSILYGTIDFNYQTVLGEVEYHYALIEGDNIIYTVDDIRSGEEINQALYYFDGEYYEGTIVTYQEEDEEEKKTYSYFRKGMKEITIKQETDEDGTGLFYRINDYSDFGKPKEEWYKISIEWDEENPDSNFDECKFIHQTQTRIVNTKTEYSEDDNQYQVHYMDTDPLSLEFFMTNFSFTLDEEGKIIYQFEEED